MKQEQKITLAHGSGGKAMRELIDNIFVKNFDNPLLGTLEDQAQIALAPFQAQGNRLAMTTDSYVVDPLFFPGGNIGKLAVTGTVNDLAMGGAKPLYLSCGMIIEEGFSISQLEEIVGAMQQTAQQAGVQIVTGDTKVVPRGACDQLVINTAGIGVIAHETHIAANRACVGDKVIVNGYIGDHGAAIVDARGDMALENTIVSDCQILSDLVQTMLEVCADIHCLRDATRGGLATVLNEFASSSQVGIRIQEAAIPLRAEVRGMCEILGLDPLYLANEGKLVAIVPNERADPLLQAMRQHPAGKDSQIIGEVVATPAERVILETGFGGERIVDMLVGEQLPRIC